MARKTKSEIGVEADKYWEEWWKPILVKKDGSIDIEQLKKELYDYRELALKHQAFICEATGNKLSKSTYTLQSLLSAFHEHVEQEREYAAKDAVDDYKTENGHNDDDDSVADDEEEESGDERDTADYLNNPALIEDDGYGDQD